MYTTYYGDPVDYGRGVVLQTLWESRGVLFHNPRVRITLNGAVVSERPFHQMKEAREEALTLTMRFRYQG